MARSRIIPEGGTSGQVLSKASNDDHDVEWAASGSGSDAASIQGQPISSSSPGTGDVLTWDGAQWEAAAPSGGGLTAYQARKRILFAGAL